jgi:hypothetical protein
MKVFSRKIQAITLLLATTASLLFTIKTHYEASRSMDAQYIGNLRHSHMAPHDLYAAEDEPVATTAPSVKLRKEGDNVSLRSESDLAPDHRSSSARRNQHNVTLRKEADNDITPSDICNLAHKLHVESEHYSSYQLGLNWSNVEHATKKLCLRSASKKKGSENQSTIQDSPSLISNDTSLILTFKVARSGSTFFTDVIMKALNTMKKAANLHWEPYCRVGCYNRKSPIKMEKELSIISSSKCSNNTIDPPICSTPGTHTKCCPVKKCQSPGFHPDAISVVSLNPRFSDSVRWDKILSSLQRPSSAKVFNLRRTNLVNLAYSKYHHDGCPVISEGLNGDECIPEKTNSTSFSFNCLLQCVQHYGEYFAIILYFHSLSQQTSLKSH